MKQDRHQGRLQIPIGPIGHPSIRSGLEGLADSSDVVRGGVGGHKTLDDAESDKRRGVWMLCQVIQQSLHLEQSIPSSRLRPLHKDRGVLKSEAARMDHVHAALHAQLCGASAPRFVGGAGSGASPLRRDAGEPVAYEPVLLCLGVQG